MIERVLEGITHVQLIGAVYAHVARIILKGQVGPTDPVYGPGQDTSDFGVFMCYMHWCSIGSTYQVRTLYETFL